MPTHKPTTTVFQALLILNIILGIFFGLTPLVNFPFVLSLTQTPYSDKLILFGVISGTAILFLASILTLSFVWTRAKKWEGPVVGIFAGMYLFCVGILALVYTGNPVAFYLDTFRGLLTIIFGYITYTNFKKL